MKWDDVQIFLAVARAETLVGAAEALGLNHSTVYRRLGQLEQDLAARLFDRDGKQYTLTAAGAAALEHAAAVEASMLRLGRAVAGRDQVPQGTVTLTAPEGLLPLLAPHLSPFRAAFPQIDLRVIFADRFLDLGRREADVALRLHPQPTATGIVGRRVAGVAWALYGPRRSPDDQDPLGWGAYDAALGHLAAEAWRQQHHGEERVALSVNSVTAMREVLCAAGCQGMLPCFVGDRDAALRRRSPPIEAAGSALWLLLHPDLRGTARVRALTDHLWGALRAEVPLLEGLTPQAAHPA